MQKSNIIKSKNVFTNAVFYTLGSRVLYAVMKISINFRQRHIMKALSCLHGRGFFVSGKIRSMLCYYIGEMANVTLPPIMYSCLLCISSIEFARTCRPAGRKKVQSDAHKWPQFQDYGGDTRDASSHVLCRSHNELKTHHLDFLCGLSVYLSLYRETHRLEIIAQS